MRDYNGCMSAYELRKSQRAKALSLTVRLDGSVLVTAPRFFGIEAIDRFVAKHADWIRERVEAARGRSIVRLSRADIPRLKREAARLAAELSRHYSARYGVTHGAITIRAQKSRWGSCSKNGNLSFNYKMAALPREIAAYIVVHEICHRIAFDHSRDFWALVEREVPDHRRLRKQLRNLVFMYR